MGYDGTDLTIGYLDSGSKPTFKILTESGDMIPVHGDIPESNNMGIFFVSLSGEVIPEGLVVSSAYPNPFNPSTSFEFGLSSSDHINVVVYNINGRIVETLVDGVMQAGYHQVTWDASEQSSGIYFVKLVTSIGTSTQKVVLIK